MSQDRLIPDVRRLMTEGKGDRVIAETLGITRHEARKLKRDVELEDARQGVAAPAMPFTETLRLDPEAWALRISARWRASINSFIETGQLLLDAKAALPHGDFTAMMEGSLPFSVNTGQRLMAIARDERISNLARAQLLPASWTTIYEISKLTTEQIDDAVEKKIIRPEVERSEIVALTRLQSSDGPRSQAEDDPDPTFFDQQGLDTSSTPGTAGHSPQGEGAGAASVANPERQPDVPDGSPVSPGPSEAHMPNGGLAIAHNRVEPSDSLDFFPTPPWATRALVEHVFDHLDRRGHTDRQVCWEPACGEGHMAEPLAEYFREVVSSDIKDYGYGEHTVDFLTCEQLARKYDADWIITNPPFGDNTDKFILKAIDLAGAGVAMLVRLQCLETVGRYEKIFKDTPPTLISFFVERVPMHKGRWEPEGDTMTAYVWLVWIKGEQPRAPFWIPPGCREALTRPDDAERFTQHPVAKAGAAPPAAEAAE